MIARLDRLVDRPAGELGSDAEALRRALERWIEPPGTITFEAALGLSATARAVFWRRERDEAICALAAFLAPGGAKEVRAALIRFAASRWRVDRHRDRMPAAYVGRVDADLFTALRAGGGRVPSARQLRRILEGERLAKTANAMANAGGQDGVEFKVRN